ncbi:cytochrome c oxidase cbb3-type subunit II [Methylacidimicrobium cyclopophantes]|uniref:Cytochrome c oxidase cbb3-type subunit II n=1 Tax=Methylacidimicrobium cyclopophantes TaxID=1041766 RepID=A0A5E6MEJ5_9BACT|nr:cbb3-type cytochrome c oxidase subunit II [Methylacidimicrobium cyclopophantes]VVM04486.1 cytochrome c oxidase cbb3-type subunit II [Methylacidimicrobium cyclopophantes]
MLLGILLATGLGWVLFVWMPLRKLGPTAPSGAGAPFGRVAVGAEVYAANGCASCHTQVVRPANLGSDIARGWGARRTVPSDYLEDHIVPLGVLRLGPDLADVGERRSDVRWYYRLLYDPRAIYPGSVMPSYRYLFARVPLLGTPLPDSLPLSGRDAPPPGFQVVPKPEARALAAYLLSLKRVPPTEAGKTP